KLLDTLRPIVGRLPFRLDVAESDGGEVLSLNGALVEAFPTRHSIVSVGYSLVERDRQGSFDVAAAKRLGVPAGPLFGRLQRGEEVALDDGSTVRPSDVLGEARGGRRVVVTGDTEPCRTTLDAAWGATVLVHEATFTEEDRERARETGHSTAREAAALAAEAGVSLLALTHLGARAMPREIRSEAEDAFGSVVVPRDFDRIEVPNPERGEPVLHRARERAAAAAEAGGTLHAHDL
ncbi:MAG: MBL fold metallo-hydrolase, partial [Miltoncostaeaceae bacterium]